MSREENCKFDLRVEEEEGNWEVGLGRARCFADRAVTRSASDNTMADGFKTMPIVLLVVAAAAIIASTKTVDLNHDLPVEQEEASYAEEEREAKTKYAPRRNGE